MSRNAILEYLAFAGGGDSYPTFNTDKVSSFMGNFIFRKCVFANGLYANMFYSSCWHCGSTFEQNESTLKRMDGVGKSLTKLPLKSLVNNISTNVYLK